MFGLCSQLHLFHTRFVCGGSGNQDPQEVTAGITDQDESEMGTKPCEAGS